MRTIIPVILCVLALLPRPTSAQAPAAEDITLVAPDGNSVDIRRDEYGVPHISAETETALFFGQGFAAAQDRLFQMYQFRLAALGRTAELLGPSQLEFDKEVRTLYYTEAERRQQFSELPSLFRKMIEAYTAGVNTYIDSMMNNVVKYMPIDFAVLPFEKWKVTHSIALMQFLIRQFGQAGGSELRRLTELQDNGQAWLDANRPINYADAPTTIPDGEAILAPKHSRTYAYSGLRVRREAVDRLERRRQRFREQTRALGLPDKFGSFAALISPQKAQAEHVLLLGCPQMGPPRENQTSIVHEVELISPTLHAGGMNIAGMPGVIIGRNEHHAWSLTSGMSDNTDIYIETTQDASFTKYRFNSAWRDFETIVDTISVSGVPEVFTHYRTVHGPVSGDDLANHQVFSEKMTFWNQELGMAISLIELARARNLAEFEAAAMKNPMSFNLFYAGMDQTIEYWHIGAYQDRTDGVDPRLPHNGDGSEEWGGLMPFSSLPHLQNPAQGYFVNWNNKPVKWWDHGDNTPWAPTTDSTRATFRVLRMENFVGPISGFTFANLKDIPRQIGDHGTYQQAIQLSAAAISGENVIPPGQSGFVSLANVPSPHKNDQWPLHVNWQFKPMNFAENVVSAVAVLPGGPADFALQQNYPNPFNPATRIEFSLPARMRVSLKIYNSAGQLVRVLLERALGAGAYRVSWDGTGASGRRVASGVYFYKLRAGDRVQSRPMLLIK